ncbi:MAG TPA: hypothetical protein VK775_07320 [Chthoniobacterales bacterium]|nr:hypothetical protein [Chthoniobacterales bacterium]
MLVHTIEDVDRYVAQIRKSAISAQDWIRAQTCGPFDLLRRMKFDPVGFDPIEGHALNIIEQINQTWTALVALDAARQLLSLHPDAGGYRLEPGAHASIPLDVMSVVPDLVGAETFATVDYRNNRKLQTDLNKMAVRNERHRYVFFMSPDFPKTERLVDLERDGVQVWSVEVNI